jgi:hypothetical protein
MKLYDKPRTKRRATANSPFSQAPKKAFKIILSVRVSMFLPISHFETPIDQFSRNFSLTCFYNQQQHGGRASFSQ